MTLELDTRVFDDVLDVTVNGDYDLSSAMALFELLRSGGGNYTLLEAKRSYLSATTMKDRSRDHYEHLWTRIEPVIGHLYIEEVDTIAFDTLKQALPKNLGPATVIQAQLGHRSEQSTHRYAHLGSKAQLRLVEGLAPASPPHSQG